MNMKASVIRNKWKALLIALMVMICLAAGWWWLRKMADEIYIKSLIAPSNSSDGGD